MNITTPKENDSLVPISKGSIAVALWDYAPKSLRMSTGDIALSMKKGDKMTVVDICPNDWLKVSLNNSIGVVPRPYLNIISTPTPSQPTFLQPELLQQKNTRYVKVLCYFCEEKNE